MELGPGFVLTGPGIYRAFDPKTSIILRRTILFGACPIWYYGGEWYETKKLGQVPGRLGGRPAHWRIGFRRAGSEEDAD